MMRLNSKQLRKGEIKGDKSLDKNEIYIILDNVLDTYNVGAIFRLSDAVGAKKILLCGGTSTPPNSRIKKSSINTTEWVEWEYYSNTKDAVEKLRAEIKDIRIYAVEQSAKSTPYTTVEYKLPLGLIVGHETYGVSQEVLDIVDQTIELPMFGINISLNVMVSLGIVLYHVIDKVKLTRIS
jgi:23S rRNA (guanosine2251-2'-O)-methyltransferase